MTTFLTGQGAPVVAPSQELPPGPHTRDGFTISFWTYLQPDPDRTPTTADCSAMLVDLHAELRAYPGELPPLHTTVVDLPRWRRMLDDVAAGAALSVAEIDRLHTTTEQLDRFLKHPDWQMQPLHGDAHPGNLVATSNGLVWIDFEEACHGPLEWDLATMSDPIAAARHHQPDPATLARCDELRALQVALCLAALRDVFGDLEGWDESIRSLLSSLVSSTQ